MTPTPGTGSAVLASQTAQLGLVDVSKLVSAYYVICPEPRVPTLELKQSCHRLTACSISDFLEVRRPSSVFVDALKVFREGWESPISTTPHVEEEAEMAA